jgi:hypothetical protein
VSEQVEIWSDGSLVGAGASVDSGWKAVATFADIMISRQCAGGVYAFEIEWSREGSKLVFSETVATSEDAPVFKDIAAPFARFRIRNAGPHSFTAHRTSVVGTANVKVEKFSQE